MPKVSQTDILTLILRDLDQIIDEQKKAGASGVPGATSKAAQAEASALGGTLSNLAISIKMLTKISTKDVDHIISTLKSLQVAIKGFKLSKSDTEGFANMLSTISSLTSTFGNISEGIWDLMQKFNPIRGKIIGRMLAKFYKNIIEGFEKEKLADYIKQVSELGGKNKKGAAENITAFSGLLTGLFAIDPEKVVQLSASLKLLSPKDGQRLAGFVSPIIEVIKTMPKEVQVKDAKKEGWKENPNISAFIGLFNALANITVASILKIWTMSKLLGPNNGKALAGFFKELLKPFSKKDVVEAAKNFRKVINTFNFTILTLVASLAIITILLVSKPKEFLIGIGIMTALIIGVYFLIKFLSSESIKESAKESLYTVLGIVLLMGGLTLVLLVTTTIAKKFPIKDIVTGVTLLAGIVIFSLGVMWLLSRKQMLDQSKKALWGVAAIVLMFTGMALAMFITISISKYSDQILKGGGIVLLYTFLAAGLFILIAKLLKPATIIKGLIGVGAIVLMMTSVSAAMLLFAKFLEKLNGMETKTILWGIGLTIGMIVGMGGLAFAAGALIMGPQAALFFAGFAAVELISVMIASVSGAMLLFAKLLEKVKEISKEDIKDAIEKFTSKEGLISALSQIVAGLASFGVKAAAKAGIISMSIRPVITTIGQFVDVVQKMASLKIADEWDKNGKPTHYMQLSPAAFKEAAANLTSAFSAFLTDLSKGLQGFDLKSVAVLKLLFPPKKQGLFGALTGGRAGIGDVIPVISQFVDLIVKMASMTIPTEWDKHGAPIKFKKLTNKDFMDAAKTVTDAFSYFIVELSSGLSQISNAPYLAYIISQLFPGPKKVKTGLFKSEMVDQPGIGTVIQSIGDFVDIIIRLATAMLPDEWDKKGNPIHYRKIENEEFIKAAKTVTKCFSIFLTQLSGDLQNKLSPLGAAVIKLISKSGINDIMASFGNLMGPIFQLATGKAVIGDKVIGINKDMLSNAGKEIVEPVMSMLLAIRNGFKPEEGNKGGNPWAQAKYGSDQALTVVKRFSEMIATIFRQEEDGALIDQITKGRKEVMYSTLIMFSDIRDKFNESGWKEAGKAARHLKKLSRRIKKSIKNIFSKNTIDLVTSDNITKINDYMNLISGIVKYINDTKFSNRKSQQFKQTLKDTSSGLDTLTKSLIKFLPISNLIRKNVLIKIPKDVDKVTKSIQKLDATLIGNQKKRIEAIQTMSDKFAEVSKSIEDLNKSMAQSNRIIREFEGEKESRSFSIFGHLADRFNVVDKIKSKVEDTAIAAKAQADELLKRNQKAPEIDTAAIVAAITAGLNDWVESQKIVNITFGEDDAKRIVGIMGES